MPKLNLEYLFATLACLFALIIVVGNLTFQKFVYLHIFNLKLTISVGVLLYPVTYLITDLVTEFYGKNKAIFIVKNGIFVNIICSIIIAVLSELDATESSKIDNDTFNNVFSHYKIAILASMIACYISQYIDIYIYFWLKVITNGRFIMLRNILSTSISLFWDSLIVISILSYFHILPYEMFFEIITGNYSYKLFCTLVLSPMFFMACLLVKKFYKTDIELEN